MPTAVLATQRASATSRRGKAHTFAQVLSLAPLWILLIVAADPQARLLSPLQPTPTLLGIQADAIIGTATLLWMAIGALVVRYGRSPLAEALGLLAFTIPATIAAVLTPAVLLLLVRAG